MFFVFPIWYIVPVKIFLFVFTLGGITLVIMVPDFNNCPHRLKHTSKLSRKRIISYKLFSFKAKLWKRHSLSKDELSKRPT